MPMIWWVCPKCGERKQQVATATEFLHPCPKATAYAKREFGGMVAYVKEEVNRDRAHSR